MRPWGLLAALLLLSGCAGGVEGSPSSDEPEALSPVYTDWSKLTNYEAPEERFTRRYTAFTDHLIPAEDYGPLLPYVGAVTGDRYTNVEKYGLVTLEGEIVTDPVYTNIYRPCYYDYASSQSQLNSFWVLERSVEQADGQWEMRLALAALDGSWCTEEDFVHGWAPDAEHYFLVDTQGALYLCSQTGELQLCVSAQRMMELCGENWYLSHAGEGGTSLITEDNQGRVDLYTGAVTPLSRCDFCTGWHGDRWALAKLDGAYGYLGEDGSWVIPPQFRSAADFQGDYALADLSDGTHALIDRSGQVVLRAQEGQQLFTWQDKRGKMWYLCAQPSEDYSSYTQMRCFDETLRENPPEWLEPQTEVHTSSGALYAQEGEDLLCFDGETSLRLPLPEGFTPAFVSWSDGYFIVQDLSYRDAVCYDSQGNILIPAGSWATILTTRDPSESSVYFLCQSYGSDYFDLFDHHGQKLAEGIHSLSSSVSYGLVHVTDSLSDGYRTLDGQWVFRVRVRDSGD